MIVFENVSYRAGNKQILKNLSFRVKKGEKALIYGKSGTGKTSVLRLIMGFVRPDSGKIVFNNKKTGPREIWEIRKKAAYVPQDLSMGRGRVENVFREILGFRANAGGEFNAGEFDRLKKTFGLDDDTGKKDIEDVSGGERQRLNIILAVMLKRDVFLLDEVTSSLDRETGGKVLDYFFKNKKFTCMCVSHDPALKKIKNIKTIGIRGRHGRGSLCHHITRCPSYNKFFS